MNKSSRDSISDYAGVQFSKQFKALIAPFSHQPPRLSVVLGAWAGSHGRNGQGFSTGGEWGKRRVNKSKVSGSLQRKGVRKEDHSQLRGWPAPSVCLNLYSTQVWGQEEQSLTGEQGPPIPVMRPQGPGWIRAPRQSPMCRSAFWNLTTLTSLWKTVVESAGRWGRFGKISLQSSNLFQGCHLPLFGLVPKPFSPPESPAPAPPHQPELLHSLQILAQTPFPQAFPAPLCSSKPPPPFL